MNPYRTPGERPSSVVWACSWGSLHCVADECDLCIRFGPRRKPVPMWAPFAMMASTFALTVACWPAPQVAESAVFASQLEQCMQTSASCADYVACQHAVQKRWNQPLSGSCDVIVDGGAE